MLEIGTDWMESRAKGHNYRYVAQAKDAVDKPIFTDMCCEEKWYVVFSKYIQPHHQLVNLNIELMGWHEIEVDPKWSSWLDDREMTLRSDRLTLQTWRSRLMNFLDDHMRGIKHTRISSTYGTKPNPRFIQRLTMNMTRNRSTAEPRPRASRTLGEALRAVHLDAKRRGG